MSFDLKDGASIHRVEESTTQRDAKGVDVTANSGDVLLTGADGSVAVVPVAVFDAVFEEVEGSEPSPDPETPETPDVPEPSPSPDAPDAPTSGPATA